MVSDQNRLGIIDLSPSGPVTAGQMVEWTLTYTAGRYGVDEGGVLMLVQRIATDIQHPQFESPREPAFTTVSTSAKCRLSYRFQTKMHSRPWQKRALIIDVEDGSLYPGDTITIVLGDRSQGSPGIRAQTFVESNHKFRFLIDPTNSFAPVRLPSSPVISILAGETEKLVCFMPTQVMTCESIEVFIKEEDVWGNPTPCPKDLEINMVCKSNPIQILDKAPRYFRYWGDLHAQTESTVGTGTEVEYFNFARDTARLDFTSHQGNDFQLTNDD